MDPINQIPLTTKFYFFIIFGLILLLILLLLIQGDSTQFSQKIPPIRSILMSRRLPVITPIQIQEGDPVITYEHDLPALVAPAPVFAIIGIIKDSQVIPLEGKYKFGRWLAIPMSQNDLEIGWIYDYAGMSDSLNDLKVLDSSGKTVPEPVFLDQPRVVALDFVNIYSTPEMNADILGMLEPGEIALVYASSENRSWWQIEVPYIQSGFGWVDSQKVSEENTLEVPIITPESDQGASPSITKAVITALANVNIREGPSLQSNLMGVLEIDQTAEVLGIGPEGFWYAIQLDREGNRIGWVSVDYVEIDNSENLPIINPANIQGNVLIPTAAVDSTMLISDVVLNIRSGPGTAFSVIAQLQPGQAVQVIGRNADSSWWAIQLMGGEQIGWVTSDFIRIDNPGNVPVINSP